jgi:hypothetical protein
VLPIRDGSIVNVGNGDAVCAGSVAPDRSRQMARSAVQGRLRGDREVGVRDVMTGGHSATPVSGWRESGTESAVNAQTIASEDMGRLTRALEAFNDIVRTALGVSTAIGRQSSAGFADARLGAGMPHDSAADSVPAVPLDDGNLHSCCAGTPNAAIHRPQI